MSVRRLEQLEVRGLRIAYERVGHGPPLFLLHGGIADAREWRRVAAQLADRYTVVAWDAPGCGASSDPVEPFPLGAYADCLVGLIDALELRPAHVAGLSFGGGLALEVYRRHPGAVRSLTLASAYAGWAGSLPADEVRRRVEQVMREVEEPPEELVRGWLPTLFSGAVPPDVVEEMRAMLLDFHPAGVRAMALAFAEADLRDVLPRVAVPTLLLYGAEDVRAPLPVAEAIHGSIPGSRLVVIPGVGHMVNMEAPDVVARELAAFLDGAS